MERNRESEKRYSLVLMVLGNRFGAQKTCPLVKIAVIWVVYSAVYALAGC